MSATFSRSRLYASKLRPSVSRRSRASVSPLSESIARRTASTATGGNTGSTSLNVLYGTVVAATGVLAYIYATDTRSFVHEYIVPPALRAIYSDAEEAHHAGTKALKMLYEMGLHPRERGHEGAIELLESKIYGQTVNNPIGISAGLDKDAEIPDVLFALGAGIVEVGGITPVPQEGNPKPRVFRVPALNGMVNRYGLNSQGAEAVAYRLRTRLRKYAQSIGVTEEDILDGKVNVPVGSLQQGRLLAVQIAKAKGTDERDPQAVIADYRFCVEKLAPYADILVVNVSSPNTPGLRDLQAAGPLTKLLGAVVEETAKANRAVRPKVMVKVSPDEDSPEQMEGIVQAVHSSGVDGVIVGNTTKSRTGLNPKNIALTAREQKALMETGGYSGPAQFDKTLHMVQTYRTLLDHGSVTTEEKSSERKTIFATGGITSGEQAWKVLNGGADLAMVYTGLVYGGAGTVTKIKREMLHLLKKD